MAEVANVYATDFKILIYGLLHLPTDKLGNVVIPCSTENDLINALMQYNLSNIIIACKSDKLIGLDILLLNHPIDKLVILNNNQENDIREWLDALILNNIIEVQTEKKLMRQLCTMIVSCYYNQNTEYRNNGNHGMANLCIRNSLQVLDYLPNFI